MRTTTTFGIDDFDSEWPPQPAQSKITPTAARVDLIRVANLFQMAIAFRSGNDPRGLLKRDRTVSRCESRAITILV